MNVDSMEISSHETNFLEAVCRTSSNNNKTPEVLFHKLAAVILNCLVGCMAQSSMILNTSPINVCLLVAELPSGLHRN